MFETLLPASVFSLLLVFVRVGAVMTLMPGVGDGFVMTRIRLLFALAFTGAVAPMVSPALPPLPQSVSVLFLLILGEFLVGLFLGSVAKITMSALAIAGTVMSHMSALANANVNSPISDQQSSIVGSFLTLTGTVLLFALGLHALIFQALVDSYALFPPGALPPIGDFAQQIAQVVQDAFLLGVQIGAPFLSVGLLLYTLMGILGRLMPQVQIFLVALPLQILGGVTILLLALPALMAWFAGAFRDTILPFTSG